MIQVQNRKKRNTWPGSGILRFCLLPILYTSVKLQHNDKFLCRIITTFPSNVIHRCQVSKYFTEHIVFAATMSNSEITY